MSIADPLDSSLERGHTSDAPSVTLKRHRGGVYGWEIHCPADGASIEEMRAALEISRTLDAELSETYGDLDEPEPEPERARAPRRSWGTQPATQSQLRFIEKLGRERGLHIDPPADKGAASTLIRKLLGHENGARS